MLSLPPQQGATAVADAERAPDGFHKLKVVAECLDSGGNVRSRRITAAIPTRGGEATHARVKWEKDGAFKRCMPLSPISALFADTANLSAASCLHEVVWSLGPVEDAFEENGVKNSEDMEDQLEELLDKVDSLEFEKKQLLLTTQTHVAGLEEEIEQLKEALDESIFEYKNFHKQSVGHVVEVRKKTASETETHKSF